MSRHSFSGLDDFLTSAEIGHDSLVDLASEKTFQAPDDLPFGSAVRRAACSGAQTPLYVKTLLQAAWMIS